MKKTFKLTNNHIILLHRFNVGWQDCETGAPEIDPKRPYGNSDVLNDIHEILTGEQIGMTDSKRDELTQEEEEKYAALHREMETALQIVLRTGTFKTGKYVCGEYDLNWRLA